MAEQLPQLLTTNRQKGMFLSQTEANLNIGPSSMLPPAHDNVKIVNVITSLRSWCLIDHNLEDLVDIPVHLSPSLSLPSPQRMILHLGMLLMPPQLTLPLLNLLT